ncbi:unnamed protein product, partial [Schistosoma turkestanicum]
STCIAIVLAVWNKELGFVPTLAVAGIILLLFTSALLIGASIYRISAAQSQKIMLSLVAIWILVVTISFVVSALKIMATK